MILMVTANVDYRPADTGQVEAPCDIEPTPLSECVAELVAALHTECWEAVRKVTARTSLVASYVVADERDALAKSVDAWKTVTCPVCSDTWRLWGYGLSTEEVAAARRVVLAAVVLGV